MAKRRAAIGKKGKHSHGGIAPMMGLPEKRRKKKMIWVISIIVVVLALVLASLLYIFILTPEQEKEKVVLTSDSLHNEGSPNEEIGYSFTIYNPGKEVDIFSPLVSGLPSDWTISLPNTVTVDGKETKDEEFSITPSPKTALNDTYPFMLNVTSRNTQRTYTLEYELTVLHTIYNVGLVCYNNSHHADPGRSTYYVLVVKNTGNGNDNIILSYNESQLPDNWTVSFEFDTINIPGLSSEIVICNITTHENTSKGRYDIDIIATSSSSKYDSVRLNTSLIKDFEDETAEIGDKVQVDYIGILTDGKIFDTSHFHIARNNTNYPKSDEFTIRSSYSPLKAYIGPSDPDTSDEYTKMIDGFWEGIIEMKVNETKVVRLPPEKAYTTPAYENHPLYGKALIFEITLVSID